MSSAIRDRRFGLSKSRITAFEQCPKRLWLSIHRPELAEFDEKAQARFNAGNAIGNLACELHPNGVMIDAEPNLAAALEVTDELIRAGHPGPFFEATFEHDGVLVRVDVLERLGGAWKAAEVKSSASVKDYYLGDLATQIWVMREAGVDLAEAAIRHIDTSFVLTDPDDFSGLFTDVSLLAELEELVQGRGEIVEEARAVLAGGEPEKEVGDHCSKPFDCEFAAYCHRDIVTPDWPVTLLPNGGGKKWLKEGIDDLLELQERDLNPKQARILRATRTGEPFHDVDGARNAVAKWGWPRAWLDFETINPAIPRWVGTRPFQQIPFQFSVHVEQKDGSFEHWEFLSCDGSDPRRACAEALVSMVPEDATIVAYFSSFEKRVLRDLAAWFPDLADRLLDMERRTVDLLPVVREHWYHREQKGSWSIKAVLPTIVPELGYSDLDVKDGGCAQEAWLEASSATCEDQRRAELAQSLREYCERDTWAMLAIARKLIEGGPTR